LLVELEACCEEASDLFETRNTAKENIYTAPPSVSTIP